MRPAARRVGLVVLVLLELLVVRSYVDRGATWHLLLHTPIGLGLGLAVGAVWSAARRRPARLWAWAVAGQLVSIAPDLLFAVARLPHEEWMDVFVGHVRVHLAAAPLAVALAVLLLGGWAAVLADAGRPNAAGLLAVATVLVLGTALLTAEPIPRSVEELRDLQESSSTVDDGPTSSGIVDARWADPALWCGT